VTAYSYWQDALAGKNPAAVVDEPQCGFYRMKRGTTWVPVAVYPSVGFGMGFKIGREVVGRNMGVELWPSYCANPITEAVYRAVAERGEPWPDADPTVTALQEAKRQPKYDPEQEARNELAFIAEDDRRNAAEDAAPKPVDPTAEFREQIQTAVAGAAAYKKIESDEASVRAASLRNMLMALANEADKVREAEKAPHLKASREVDTKWQPVIKQAREGAQAVRTAMEGWENDKRRAAAAAASRAAEENSRRETAAAHNDISAPPPEPAKPQSNLPAPAAQIKPTFGKASGVQTFELVTAIDAVKVFEHFKAHPDVTALLTKLAQAALNAGIEIDGVTHETRTRIK